ncbi:MAG: Unknown protein [uncultured Thiotrichaceae bacterium]|uniref:Lipoprotein n=1 Tax=uncultured Thiotrichaceae bacterium TaxID=298394 RepID=A0A6S6TPQ0_9GAMM|nr:MAG: Unknown protein [uncultured Thiotrichaceae bacterium]
MIMINRLFGLTILLFLLSGCGTAKFQDVSLNAEGRPVPVSLTYADKEKITELYNALIELSADVDKVEAKEIAFDSVIYPMYLAKKYGLVYPPQYHNVLVNTGKRPRGLCYEWADDMTALMKRKNLRTFDIHRGTAFRMTKDEHNTLILSAKDEPLEKGIVIDPWRHSGELYWAKVPDDKDHPWTKFIK